MNSELTEERRSIAGYNGTTAGGSLVLKTLRMICISGALYIGGTVSTGVSAEIVLEPIAQTSSGYKVSNGKKTGEALMELRRLSGMTWDQLARLFGVARRSLHFWASGKSLNAGNEEKLHRVLSIIHEIDRGTAQANRAALFTPQEGGIVVFDLLRDGRFGDVLQAFGQGVERERAVLPPLSAKSRALRMPIKPAELAIGSHEPVHRNIGKQRKAKATRIKRTIQGDET